MSLIRPCDVRQEEGRQGGREGAPLPACLVVARYFLLTFGFLTRVLASATKIPEEEGTKWDRFSLVDPIGNKSQSPLPLLFLFFGDQSTDRDFELDAFRAPDPRLVSSSLSFEQMQKLPPSTHRQEDLGMLRQGRRTLNLCHVSQVAQSVDPRGVRSGESGGIMHKSLVPEAPLHSRSTLRRISWDVHVWFLWH